MFILKFLARENPVYSSENAAGCDLFATEDMVLRPGETKLMPLNLIMAIPLKGSQKGLGAVYL